MINLAQFKVSQRRRDKDKAVNKVIFNSFQFFSKWKCALFKKLVRINCQYSITYKTSKKVKTKYTSETFLGVNKLQTYFMILKQNGKEIQTIFSKS